MLLGFADMLLSLDEALSSFVIILFSFGLTLSCSMITLFSASLRGNRPACRTVVYSTEMMGLGFLFLRKLVDPVCGAFGVCGVACADVGEVRV